MSFERIGSDGSKLSTSAGNQFSHQHCKVRATHHTLFQSGSYFSGGLHLYHQGFGCIIRVPLFSSTASQPADATRQFAQRVFCPASCDTSPSPCLFSIDQSLTRILYEMTRDWPDNGLRGVQKEYKEFAHFISQRFLGSNAKRVHITNLRKGTQCP